MRISFATGQVTQKGALLMHPCLQRHLGCTGCSNSQLMGRIPIIVAALWLPLLSLLLLLLLLLPATSLPLLWLLQLWIAVFFGGVAVNQACCCFFLVVPTLRISCSESDLGSGVTFEAASGKVVAVEGSEHCQDSEVLGPYSSFSVWMQLWIFMILCP